MIPIEAGTRVRYHGSIEEMHGEYEVTGVTDPDYLRAVKGDAVVDHYYPDEIAYNLWPVGVLRKHDLRHLSLYDVRPESVTVVESEDGPDPASTLS